MIQSLFSKEITNLAQYKDALKQDNFFTQTSKLSRNETIVKQLKGEHHILAKKTLYNRMTLRIG